MILTLLLYSFVAFTSIQIIYYLIFSSVLFDSKKKKENKKEIPISVIVCAKNEAKNLKLFLPSILNQEYPDFEVVLINDASSDETLEVMKSFEEKHSEIEGPNLCVLPLHICVDTGGICCATVAGRMCY